MNTLDFTPVPSRLIFSKLQTWLILFSVKTGTVLDLRNCSINAFISQNEVLVKRLKEGAGIVTSSDGRSFELKNDLITINQNDTTPNFDAIAIGTFKLDVVLTDSNGIDHSIANFVVEVKSSPIDSTDRVTAINAFEFDLKSLSYSMSISAAEFAQKAEVAKEDAETAKNLTIAAKNATLTAKDIAVSKADEIKNIGYLGLWNAATNTPTLTAAPNPSLEDGAHYDVSVAGSQSITGSLINFSVKDQIKKVGSSWVRVPFVTNILAKTYHFEGAGKLELEGDNITFPLLRRENGSGGWDESNVTTLTLAGTNNYVLVRKNGIKSGSTGLLEITKGTQTFFWNEPNFSEYDVLIYKSAGVWKSHFTDIQKALEIWYSYPKTYHFEGSGKLELEGNNITFPLLRRENGAGGWDESNVTTLTLAGANDYVLVRKNGIKSGTTGLLEITKGTLPYFWNEPSFSEYDVLMFKSAGVWKSQFADIQKAIDYLNKGYIDDKKVTYGQYIAPNQLFTTQTGWLTHIEKVLTDGSIKKIRVNVNAAGTYTFAVGILDQFNKQIIRKEYPVTLIAGEQNIDVNFPVKAGDNLFLRVNQNVKYWHSGGNGQGTNFLYSDDPLSALMYLGNASYGGGIPLSFIVENRDSIFAFKEDIVATNQKVAAIETVQQANVLRVKSPDGKEWQLKISNAGTLSAIALTVSKWIALGNSITIHPITNFWWGNWGMAATTRDKDWVHVLNAKIATKYNLTPVFVAKNIATWETSYSTYDLTQMNSYFEGDESLVVLKVGENVTYAANYATHFDNLVKYLKVRCPLARIIVAGTFWRHDEKEVVHKAVADANNCIYVQLFQLDNPANMSTLDTQVYGDDGEWHTISSGGSIAGAVASHPGDVGMQNIADAIFSVL